MRPFKITGSIRERCRLWLTEKTRPIPERYRPWLVALGFIILQAFVWFVLFEVLWYKDRSITDTPEYYDYASRIVRGMVPYRDFAAEYPPVAMVIFWLPRRLSGPGYDAFVRWFEVEMFLFSCGNITLITVAAGRLWGSARKLAGALGAYTFLILAMGSIVESRFDMAAAFIILAGAVSFITDRYLLAWLLLGVGLMTKVVPALLAPVFLIAHFRRRQYWQLLWGPLAMLLAATVIALPFIFSAPAGLAGAFLYHVERPLQLESSWASPLLLAARFGGYPVRIMNAYGSHNVYSTLSNTMAQLSAPVTILLLLAEYWIFFRRSRGADDGRITADVVRFSTAAVATFILGGKVFSPQFLIWLLPMVVLIKGPDRRVTLGIFAAVVTLTQIEFPFNYWRLYSLEGGIIAEVALRNLMLAVFLGMMLFYRQQEALATVPRAVETSVTETAEQP